jgi:GNAT superfamily N-acetyltransferase
MLVTRVATGDDAKVITHHRRQMFADAGNPDTALLDVISENFEPWVTERLLDGRYLGWLTLDGDRAVAGLGMLLLDWPPHLLDPWHAQRGYLMNMYVEPDYRRKRLASHLMDLALAEARRREIRVVALHATEEGRTVYENKGFTATNEMFHLEPEPGSLDLGE